ncbi:M15 family metallopeptidase [Ferrimonas sp. SCSIO 43195]|uniref:M15 family metallopeptidase n=1 Tax=Ferrimonas sp. SCSIO 43195 TaxID=2822844 RepID=UPI0020758AAB|nr:M15 family metallopeptidase [Ferrimonas sp. SCSIO 43195]USD36321.1 M15 family metallopeptidase [Ferrimonas sp. SCSIO 43195]
MLTQSQLMGLEQTHLMEVEDQLLECRTAVAFRQMQEAASKVGLDLQCASGWCSFDSQLSTFNGKVMGKQPLVDEEGRPLNPANLNDNELLRAILAWSSLPGTSRRHWGCDFNFYDANAISRDNLKLEPLEYRGRGPNGKLNRWLDEHMTEYGFFRPYTKNLGGVQPEPWHLSFAPVALPALAAFDERALAEHLKQSKLALKSHILERLPELLRRYFYQVTPAPAATLRNR